MHTRRRVRIHTRREEEEVIPRKAHVEFSLGPRRSPKKPLDLTNFQFENTSRTTCSRFLQPFALPDENCSIPALLRHSVEGSFAPNSSITNDLHGNIAMTSTRFSPDFSLLTLRSPSFKSQHLSHSKPLSRAKHAHRQKYTHVHIYIHTYTCTYPYIH